MSEPTKESKPKKDIVSPDSQHFEELVWETIIMRGNVPYYQKWLFKKEDFPCGRCHTPQNVKFMSLPTGVYKTCTYCGFTEGVAPQDPDTGDDIAIIIEEKTVSIDEAWEVLKRHKSDPYAPPSLPRTVRRRRRRTE
jgi:hypothetical protein